ncbi:LuxR C-terminal-related transcriptional regulator [Dactylosporangium siamense]|uniref:Transcriptional regulator n=1 Tax=Dactylosporangium siamense TaxID=685454 RepID=A0A919UJA3_9ACTN|nr:LuxR family transcriptional regulator [Dactylosporangium siamense]GIG52483.1 transcriptional regulator [Dactylosporangium siamense]
MDRVWPLIGRAEELGFVEAAMRRRTGARGVVLAGSAGVGRTRLAQEAVRGAGRRCGGTTIWATATATARHIPLGAFAGHLGGLGEDPARVLHHAAEALLSGVGDGGLVVGVDDAHLLDHHSALLVHQLTTQDRARLVLTVRSGEPAPDAVTALWKEGTLERLELQPLSVPATHELLAAVLGGPPDSALSAAMWRLTRGNVVFLRHVVEAERAAVRLREVRGVWRWAARHEISAALADLIDAQMGMLTPPVRDVVDLLALGEPLGMPLLCRLADPAAVEEAEAGGLILVERDGDRHSVRLAHPLYGETRRARIGTVRARRLRGAVAAALAAAGTRRPDDALQLATLALDSDYEPGPTLLTAAARRAAELADRGLAGRVARAAVAAGGGFEAQLLVVASLTPDVPPPDADLEFAALTTLATDDDALVRATVLRVLHLAFDAARPDEAQAVLRAAERGAGTPEAALQLCAVRGHLAGALGRPAEAVAAASAALSSPTLPDEAVVLAACGLIGAMGMLGRADRIPAVAARAEPAAARLTGLAHLRLSLARATSGALRLAGRLDEASSVANGRHGSDRHGTAGHGADRHGADRHGTGGAELSAYLMGEAALSRGRLGDAVRWLREARAGLAESGGAGGVLFLNLVALARALALRGDVDDARMALAEAEAERHPAMVTVEPELLLTRAWITAMEGSVVAAVCLAREAAVLAAAGWQPAGEVLALQHAVCLGDETAADRLAVLSATVTGPRAPAAAAHAAALAAGEGDALRAACARWERIGDLTAAVHAAAQAAAAYTRRGRRGAALLASATAQRIAEAGGFARPPVLAAIEWPSPLTGREREIVALAARGLANKAIAERLGVSVRTVEGHLYRAGAKLGVTSRAGFADVLRVA